MKYTIKAYKHGICVMKKTVEKPEKDAVIKVALKWSGHSHVMVTDENGKTVRIFRDGKKTSKKPAAYNVQYDGRPSILLLIGGVSELHRYTKPEERDRIFAWLTHSERAESVKADKELIDTTVSSEGMSDSKGISTSPTCSACC